MSKKKNVKVNKSVRIDPRIIDQCRLLEININSVCREALQVAIDKELERRIFFQTVIKSGGANE